MFIQKWILTAAHCLTELPQNGTFSIVAGRHNISAEFEVNEQIRSINRTFVHNNYTGGVAPDDIALVIILFS